MASATQSTQYVFVDSGPQPQPLEIQKTIRRHVMSEVVRQKRVRFKEGAPSRTENEDPFIVSRPSLTADIAQACETRPPQPGLSLGKLQFLNISEPSQAREKTRQRLVRRHVMNQYTQMRRRERPSNEAPDGQSLGFVQLLVVRGHREVAACVCRSPGMFRLADIQVAGDQGIGNHPLKAPQVCTAAGTCAACGRHITWNTAAALPVSPQVVRLGASVVDPFAVYPMEMSPHMHKLIHHYIKFLAPRLPQARSESAADTFATSMVTAALRNNGLLQGMLYAASAHSDMLRGAASSALTIFHQVQTLQLINKELSRAEVGLSDTLISTILFLANFENMNGNLLAAQAHMRGLQHIVELRGGLAELGLNGQLASMLIICDRMGAALQTSKPVFPAYFPHIPPSSPPPADILPIRNRQDSIDHAAHGFSAETLTLLHAIRDITVLLRAFHQGLSSSTATASLLAKRSQIQVLLPPATSPPALSHQGNSIYESCRLAALIYWQSLYTTTPLSAPTNAPTMQALKSALDETTADAWWVGAPEALVWVCLVGGAAAQHRPERGWFVARLGPVMVTLGSRHPAELQRSLGTFAWVAGMCEAGQGLF